MRALVTGAAGFVGSNLALRLEGDGHEVVALDDFTSGDFRNLQGFSGDFVAADLCDVPAWADRVGQVDAVFHQAAITDTTVTDQKRMMRSNVEAFRLLLRWAAERGIKTVVYASSAGIYGDGPVPMRETAEPRPLNVYAFSKRVMEKVAADFARGASRDAHRGAALLQRVRAARALQGPRGQHDLAAGPADARRQAAAHLRATANSTATTSTSRTWCRPTCSRPSPRPSGAYNVCTGQKTTFNEIIRFLNPALGTKLEPDYFKNPYSFYQNETLGDPALAQQGFRLQGRFLGGEGHPGLPGGEGGLRQGLIWLPCATSAARSNRSSRPSRSPGP